MAERPKMYCFAKEVRIGDQKTKSNCHKSKMGSMEEFRTLEKIQFWNGKILHYMEQQNEINQQMMQNLMKLQSQVQQVSFLVRREGEESMIREIVDRYHHSWDKNVGIMRVHP